MHLMSLISPVDDDLAVVYSRLLPVPFRERLLDRGVALVETPGRRIRLDGHQRAGAGATPLSDAVGQSRHPRALERAGATVVEYEGSEISLKGGGGPTCLTRPLDRTA